LFEVFDIARLVQQSASSFAVMQITVRLIVAKRGD